METINNDMQMRMTLLKETGYNVEKAQKCWDFVCGDYEQKQTNYRFADGVYLIDIKGNAVRYDGEDTETVNDTAYIGIVQGCHSVAIALNDVNKDEITLTVNESKKDNGGCIDNYMDAVHDWDGKGNTKLLKTIGINPVIKLKAGEYIPTLAELYLICLNQKSINEAMRFVGGQELKGWYWSSTECNATNAWNLCINNGHAYRNTQAMIKYRVRPVSAFLQN